MTKNEERPPGPIRGDKPRLFLYIAKELIQAVPLDLPPEKYEDMEIICSYDEATGRHWIDTIRDMPTRFVYYRAPWIEVGKEDFPVSDFYDDPKDDPANWGTDQ